MSQMQRRTSRAIAAAIVAIVSWVVVSGTASAASALTAADLVRFLKAGISEQTILVELRDRGFAEPLDETHEAELRAAGASETLVVAVRRAAPPPQAITPWPPPWSAPGSGEGSTPSRAGRTSPSDAGSTPSKAGSTPTVGTQGPTFSASARTVRVPVSVLDKQGEPVVGLKSADFRVSEDGKPQAITLFSGERRPLRIAVALDISRSMDDKIREVEEALQHFIDVLEPADQILVITFNDEVNVVQDFTSDREVLGRVLQTLRADGGTALYDAAYEAIERVAAAPAESKAVVLVTDGVDTASTNSLEDVRDLARRAEVPVFSIGLDSGGRPELRGFPGGMGGWPGGRGRGGWGGGRGGWGRGGGFPGGGGRFAGRGPESFDAGPLNDLADDTGARVEIVKGLDHDNASNTDPPGGQRLKTAVESIAMILRHRYLIGYDPPTSKHDWRKIKVEVDRPDATARARKGYYAGA